MSDQTSTGENGEGALSRLKLIKRAPSQAPPSDKASVAGQKKLVLKRQTPLPPPPVVPPRTETSTRIKLGSPGLKLRRTREDQEPTPPSSIPATSETPLRIRLAAPEPEVASEETATSGFSMGATKASQPQSEELTPHQQPTAQAIPQQPVIELSAPIQMVSPQFQLVLNTVKPGIRWKEYLIVRPLGVGLAGATYEGLQSQTGKRVALKFFDVNDDDIAQGRFMRFAERLKSLEHDSICKILDYVWQPPYVFLISELLTFRDGPAINLEQYCERYVPAEDFASERQVLKVGYQLANALAAAHDLAILHGDLKPANLLFEDAPTSDGSLRLRMRITDFGVAQIMGAEAFTHKMNSVLTFAEEADQPAIETAAFFSPEQWKGAPVNKFSDLFSAAAVIHYFLTLNWEAKRKRPSTYRPGIHEAWDPVICMGLRKSPDDRFQSASEFAEYLNVIEAPKV